MTTQMPPEAPDHLCEFVAIGADPDPDCKDCRVQFSLDSVQVADIEAVKKLWAERYQRNLELATFWGITAIRSGDKKLRSKAIRKLNAAMKILSEDQG